MKNQVQLNNKEINQPDQQIYEASRRDSADVQMHVGTLKQTMPTKFNHLI